MENHQSQTYQKRMNQTASSKFDVLAPHLKKDVMVLDFGSGFSPDFIEQVKATGALYTAYDISPIVQQKLQNHSIDFLTEEDLQTTKNEFDIIYLSSVFHELMSYLSRVERTRVFTLIDQALKPDGLLLIRDWGHASASNKEQVFTVASNSVNQEVDTWIDQLVKNAIIERPAKAYGPNDIRVSPYSYMAKPKDIYEVMLHTVWGLDSLEREAKETYAVQQNLIEKWIGQPLNYRIEKVKKEKDQSYLPHLQKYFDIQSIPWPTKIIYELRKRTA